MMQRFGIRTRLTILYGGLLFLALALSGTAVITLLKQRLYERFDQSLDRRLQGVEDFLRRETTPATAQTIPTELEEYASTQPEGYLIEVRDESGGLLLRSAPVPPPARFREREFALYGRLYRTKAAGSLRPIEESLQEIGYVLLGATPVLFLLIATTGYWIVSRSLRPVDEMTKAARSMSASNLAARLPVPPSGDELSRLAEAWNEMLGRLEESFARIQRFTGDAAHEFRTPLTGLRTTADLALRRPREPEQYREALAQVVAISDRMTHLSDDLLALARGEGSPSARTSGPVDLAGLVRGVVVEMDSIFRAKKLRVDLKFECHPILPTADARGLRRLVAALLDNAQKYTREGGSVTIWLKETQLQVQLEITDTGCGIPEEALTRIFDRFYRVDSSRDRETGGYGLGLAIAQQIAAEHNGHIVARSAAGQGSTFCLSLSKPA